MKQKLIHLKGDLMTIKRNLLYISCLFYSLLLIQSIQPCDQIVYSDQTFRSPCKKNAGKKKDWTLIVYIAADNDLRGFAARNIKQMADVGSNDFLNIAVQLDIRITGNKKITRRYYIEQNKILHVNSEDPTSQKMDSGDPRTLVSCCKWAIENYPAQNYALVLWNHGTGVIDPETGRIINPSPLFAFNPESNQLELDRSIEFLEYIENIDPKFKGICWDDSTGNYLTNQKLDAALNEICTTLLDGQKLNIIGFDACLMAMLEIAEITKKYAHVMVCSQEVELGAGWNYERVLSPFRQSTMSQEAFAKHIVEAYYEVYSKITPDYTQSAINLDDIEKLETNVNTIANLLTECLSLQKNNSVKNAIQASRSKLLCTHFDEPSYVDMHHFYTNLLANLKHFSLTNPEQEKTLKASLMQALEKGRSYIKELVLANRVGKNLSLAQGISIYFPERRIHPSYRKTSFAAKNKWITFMTQYLLT